MKHPVGDLELRRMLAGVFGPLTDPIEGVAERARRALPGEGVIVWEGDASTFEFTFVNPSAEGVLGYPAARWVSEPTFWADVVVHKEDRDDAIAYCALATARQCEHEFEYRAIAADGRIVWLRDFVRVVSSLKGVPERLRGVMIDVSDEKRAAGAFGGRPAPEAEFPSRAALLTGRG